MNIVEIKNLTKDYGKNRGIKNINLEIREGEILGFVGPNGAGKSTTIRTLLNFIFPTSGEAKIFGKDIISDSLEIKKNIGYVPSEVKFYNDSKVRDIINYSASFYSNSNKEEIEKLCERFEVELDKKMGELSLGNKKKVAIVQALLHSPKLLILDEPTNGLDPLIQTRLFEMILEEKKKGTTIFFSSHNLVEVENLCDRVAIIKEGQLVDVLEMENIVKETGVRVAIKSKEITLKFIEELEGQVVSFKDEEGIFNYFGESDILIKKLATIKIEEVSIGEQSLEDRFMGYYKKEGNN